MRYQSAIKLFKRTSAQAIQKLDDQNIAEEEEGCEGFFPNALAVIGDSFSLLLGSKDEGATCNPKDKKTHGTIVFLGQTIIIIGYIVAVSPLISGLFILSMKNSTNFSF
ncbi:MAG: hypothetical protein GQ574_23430 [Crocinitomix sp.]|nr:hypothetical protein [Crocinitomix sp.]